MNTLNWVKPTTWGAIGGAIAAIAIGFSWGGWVTVGTASQMETASAKAAVVQAFTPLCIARAEQEPGKLVVLREESSWKHKESVINAGWVDNVSKHYRTQVARNCATVLMQGAAAE